MTSEQIDNRQWEIMETARSLGGWKNLPKEILSEDYELSFRSMINSCMCYGNAYGSMGIWDNSRKCWGYYALTYVGKLGDKKAHEVWDDQREFFYKHARVSCGVYTDHEGSTYNSISWN